MTQMGDSIRRRSGRGAGRGQGDEPGTRTRRRTGTGGPSLDWKRWILWGVGGAAFAFLLGWIVATQILFPKPALARDEVSVPDLTGMSLTEAREELANTQLEIGPVREMVHPNMRRGVVIAQDPVEGQTLRPGAEVGVAVSQGRARVTVPDLVGMPADAAVELARRVGFEIERVDEPTIEEAGSVLRVEPEPGRQVELPARLTVVVSAGGLAPPDTTPVVTEPIAPPVDENGKVLNEGFDAENE